MGPDLKDLWHLEKWGGSEVWVRSWFLRVRDADEDAKLNRQVQYIVIKDGLLPNLL